MRRRKYALPLWLGAIVTIMWTSSASLAADRTLAPGDSFTGIVPFSDYNWPLPPGKWEVAANVPILLPSNEVGINRVLLVQFQQNQVKALVMLHASDKRMKLPKTQSMPACETGPPPFLLHSYKHSENVVDCWRINNTTNDRTPARDMLLSSADAWLNARGSQLPKSFFQVNFGSTYGGRMLQVNYGFDPTFYFADKGAATPPFPFSVSDIVALRHWAIRWHKVVVDHWTGSSAAPPALEPRNTSKDAFMPPLLGLKEGQILKDVVSIGPLRVPLPPGEWKVVARSPVNNSNGELAIDNVVLVRIIDKKLDGMVNIAHIVGDSLKGGVCDPKRAHIHEKEEDEFCAAMNGYQDDDPVRLEHDFVKLALTKLRAEGITTYKQMAGGYFGFTNHLSAVQVFILYSPSHLGLQDRNYGEAIPPGWLDINDAAWLKSWSTIIKAGLTGDFETPVFKNTARLDLQAERRPENTKLSGLLEHSVTINGTTVPLPEGKWEILANVPQRNAVGEAFFDELILGQIRDGVLTATTHILSNKRGVRALPRSPEPLPCSDTTPNQKIIQHDKENAMDCWAMLVSLPLDQEPPTVPPRAQDAAILNLKSRHIKTPFMMGNMYFIGTKDRYVLASYMFAPHAIDARTPLTYALPAYNGEPTMITPDQQPAGGALLAWGPTWHSLLRKGFEGNLKPADMATATTRPQVQH